MKFRIEQILTIKSKVYVFGKSYLPETNFKLSDTCFLGGVPIENWYDVPRASDKNGNQRTDLFTFVLKNPADGAYLHEQDEVELLDQFVKAIEPMYTVSGVVLCIIESGTGRNDPGCILQSVTDGKAWRIIDNNLLVGGTQNQLLLKEAEKKFQFFYKLEPISHSDRPQLGEQLQVQTNAIKP